MRKKPKIARIINIHKIEKDHIIIEFNNGEKRDLNILDMLKRLDLIESGIASKLLDHKEIKKVGIQNDSLSWGNIKLSEKFKDREILLPFEIGADVLYQISSPIPSEPMRKIADLIKGLRKSNGLTQAELAKKSGTTRNYISRIENAHSDIEIGTLRKIIESGFGKKMIIDVE